MLLLHLLAFRPYAYPQPTWQYSSHMTLITIFFFCWQLCQQKKKKRKKRNSVQDELSSFPSSCIVCTFSQFHPCSLWITQMHTQLESTPKLCRFVKLKLGRTGCDYFQNRIYVFFEKVKIKSHLGHYVFNDGSFSKSEQLFWEDIIRYQCAVPTFILDAQDDWQHSWLSAVSMMNKTFCICGSQTMEDPSSIVHLLRSTQAWRRDKNE